MVGAAWFGFGENENESQARRATSHDSLWYLVDAAYHLLSELVVDVKDYPSSGVLLDWDIDGTFKYKPDDEFVGQDSFTYTLHDGIVESGAATVTINVTNEAPTVQATIDDVWHWARDGDSTETVTLWDYFQDTDDTDQQLEYRVVGNSNDTLVGTSIDPANGELTLTFDAAPGYADITVRATDRPGEPVEQIFRAWSVDVQGMTVEEHYWGDDDTTWCTAGEPLWSSDEHRWATTVLPAAAEAFVESVQWYAEVWTGQMEALGTGFLFAESSSADPAIGSPGPGDWYIYVVATIGVVLAQSMGQRTAEVAVTEIEWEGIDPGDGQTNLHAADGDTRTIYPGRNVPGGPKHDHVDLRVTIQPAMPTGMSGTLNVKIFDPDNAQVGGADPNDGVPGLNVPVDNRRHGGDFGGQNRAMTPGEFTLTFNQGESTKTQDMTITYAQPGNNYLAVVHHKSEIIADLEFRSDGRSLFYPEPPGDEEYDVTEEYHSTILVVRRKLWVESDHMDTPGPNDGPFGSPLIDDDDHYDEQFTPSAPTTTTLAALLEPAYVDVETLAPQYNPDTTTDFKHYQLNRQIDASLKDVESSEYFWAVHMLGAYEWHPDNDNDPNNQSDWLAGWSESGDQGTNFILEETARDLWAEPQMAGMVAYATGLDRICAHEALHRFLGWHVLLQTTPPQPDPTHFTNHGIMDGTTLMTSQEVELTDEQIRVVQAKEHP